MEKMKDIYLNSQISSFEMSLTISINDLSKDNEFKDIPVKAKDIIELCKNKFLKNKLNQLDAKISKLRDLKNRFENNNEVTKRSEYLQIKKLIVEAERV